MNPARHACRRYQLQELPGEELVNMRRLSLVATVLLAWNCSDATGSRPPGPPLRAIVLDTTVLANATVGTTITVSAKILDSASVAVPNQVVNFVATAGGGTVFAAAVQSSAAGVVANQWTLGTKAGTQSLEIRWVE